MCAVPLHWLLLVALFDAQPTLRERVTAIRGSIGRF